MAGNQCIPMGCRPFFASTVSLSILLHAHSPCMVRKLDPILSRATISKLYRFALLLTGDASSAEQTLLRVFEEFAQQIGQFRTEKHRTAFLVAKIRESFSKRAPEAQPPPVENTFSAQFSTFSAQFSTLSEPARSALALFYLDLFPVSELAALLNLSMEDLGAHLRSGREQLGAKSEEPK